jgi:hypothetical protein
MLRIEPLLHNDQHYGKLACDHKVTVGGAGQKFSFSCSELVLLLATIIQL